MSGDSFKSPWWTLVGILLLLTPIQNLDCQEQLRFRLSPMFGGTFFLSDVEVPSEFQDAVKTTSFENAFHLGLEAGYRLTNNWEVEGAVFVAPESEFTAVSTSGVGASVGTEVVYLSGNLLYYFGPRRFNPFVSIGVGTRSQDLFGLFGGGSNFRVAGNFGGGVSVQANRTLSVRLWVRDFVSTFDQFEETFDTGKASTQHDLLLSAGLSFSLF